MSLVLSKYDLGWAELRWSDPALLVKHWAHQKMAVTKDGGGPNTDGPRFSKVGRDAFHGSRRVVVPMQVSSKFSCERQSAAEIGLSASELAISAPDSKQREGRRRTSREQWSQCRNLHAPHPALWEHRRLLERCIHACCPSYIQTVPGHIRRLPVGLPQMSIYNLTVECIHAAWFQQFLHYSPIFIGLLLLLSCFFI